MPFISNTLEQQDQMLAEIGLTKQDLFADIPAGLLCKDFRLPPGLSEQRVRDSLAELAEKNST
ncbi:unnamed protein product, partial [marine sediment metagenome]